MKAAVLVKQNAPLEMYEVDLPKLGIGQVLVKVEHSGICGKQIDEITGRQGEDRFMPHLLGHAGGGEVLEIGVGVAGVGLTVVQCANLVSAYPIVAIDKSDEKLAYAGKFGATHTINADTQDVAAVLRDLSRGRGFDAVVDTTGLNKVRETAYDA